MSSEKKTEPGRDKKSSLEKRAAEIEGDGMAKYAVAPEELSKEATLGAGQQQQQQQKNDD